MNYVKYVDNPIENRDETGYEYAVGNLEQIKKGDIKDLPKTEDVHEAKSSLLSHQKNSKVIGVYKRMGLMLRFPSGNIEQRHVRMCNQERHPHLIQIGYNPKSAKLEKLNLSLGYEPRIKLIPCEEMNPVSDKVKEQERIFLDAWKERGYLEITDMIKYHKLLKSLEKTEGLTHDEEIHLRSLDGLIRGDMGPSHSWTIKVMNDHSLNFY